MSSASGSRAAATNEREGGCGCLGIALHPRPLERTALGMLGCHRDLENLERLVVRPGERVDADLGQIPLFEPPLLLERGLGDLLNEPAVLDAVENPLEHGPVTEVGDLANRPSASSSTRSVSHST